MNNNKNNQETLKEMSINIINPEKNINQNKKISKRIPKLRLEVIPNFHGNNKQN